MPIIYVKTPDLEPGDIILQCGKTTWAYVEYVVNEKPTTYDERYCTLSFKHRGVCMPTESRLTSLLWEVCRPNKIDTSQYPHKCPRCGAQAYVGFLEISHASDTTCPARKG